jgi:hypothetical protein
MWDMSDFAFYVGIVGQHYFCDRLEGITRTEVKSCSL